MIALTVIGFFLFMSVETGPIEMEKCTTTEMAYLIRLDIPDEKIMQICEDVE